MPFNSFPKIFKKQTFLTFLISLASLPAAAVAGVMNPDISALGQVRAALTDDAGSPDQNRPTLGLGETELIFDAALNPYFRGAFTFAAGEEGFGVEEAYASMIQGLPWGLGLKAGKYRLGFGRINPVHPHAYPFLDAPRAWASLMPGGEEGFNETAVQVSDLLPTPGTWASTVSVDAIQGSSFHTEDERTRLGWLGRWSNAFLIGEKGALEAGVSGATGLDAIDAGARGYLLGADLKVKFYLSGGSQFTLQTEAALRRSHALDTATGAAPAEQREGFYGFADYRFRTRYNAGVLFEQWERSLAEGGVPGSADRAVKVFAGFAVLEESTVLRVAFEHFMPDGGPAVNTASAQLLFSMGPHKAHKF
ncbi:MAG: hypothetical protein K0Q91_922 [Fibrobacteria bacterium]|jgi:hypothetical protein|nr:hypothetical protein [Fibrobacteria bacterium]